MGAERRTSSVEGGTAAPALRRAQRVLLFAGVAALALVLLRPISLAELDGRLSAVEASRRKTLTERRLAAASTDLDRRLLQLTAWARGRVPAGASGIAVVPERPITGRRAYLVAYELVPTPAEVTSGEIPPGWLALVQGERRLPGWKVLDESPLGALLAPPP